MASIVDRLSDIQIGNKLKRYQDQGQFTTPCILAPPPPKMILGPTEEMDPKLWGNLQHHISLESIFVKLPFREFFQLRLLCKDFHAMTFDKKFLEANATPLNKKPFFCLVHPNGIWQLFVEYDRVSNEWHQLPIPTPNGDHPPMWSAGGYLVFVVNGEGYDWIFTVFDLRTKMQHKLPLLYIDGESYFKEFHGLIVNQVDNTFRLVVAEIGCTKIQTSIYDSVTRAWDQNVQHLPLELTKLEGNQIVFPRYGSVCHNGNLYVLMYDVPCITSYDLARGVWSTSKFPVLDPSGIDLGSWDGRLYAISSGWDLGTRTMGLYVHQLFEGTNNRWDEVCSIPRDLSNELFETNDPSPTQNELDVLLETHVQASFCDEYVLVSVFLQDYFVVDSGCDDGYKIWLSGTLVPRKFALLNLETQQWERLDFPVSRDRRRMEVGSRGLWHCFS